MTGRDGGCGRPYARVRAGKTKVRRTKDSYLVFMKRTHTVKSTDPFVVKTKTRSIFSGEDLNFGQDNEEICHQCLIRVLCIS